MLTRQVQNQSESSEREASERESKWASKNEDYTDNQGDREGTQSSV